MAKEQKRLGRGLSSLISTDFAQTSEEPTGGERTARQSGVRVPSSIPVAKIKRNPYQPRATFAEPGMADLTRSIQQSGIIQPLVVRPVAEGWELIAGERRLRAAIQAGLDDVPVVVRGASDEEVLELALIENIHREDLNGIERARAYQKYADEFKLPVEKIAERVGEDRSTVANYLRLLELGEDIQKLVAERAIAMGHARCLLGVPGDAERLALAEAVVQNDLSVRTLEDIVRRKRTSAAEQEKPIKEQQPRALVRDIQERLTSSLGVRVTIRERRKPNTGRIIIDYSSLDDFNRITEALGLDGA